MRLTGPQTCTCYAWKHFHTLHTDNPLNGTSITIVCSRINCISSTVLVKLGVASIKLMFSQYLAGIHGALALAAPGVWQSSDAWYGRSLEKGVYCLIWNLAFDIMRIELDWLSNLPTDLGSTWALPVICHITVINHSFWLSCWLSCSVILFYSCNDLDGYV